MSNTCCSNTQPQDFSDFSGQRFSFHPSYPLQVFRGLCSRLSSSETLAPPSGTSPVFPTGKEHSRESHTSRSLLQPRSDMCPNCPQLLPCVILQMPRGGGPDTLQSILVQWCFAVDSENHSSICLTGLSFHHVLESQVHRQSLSNSLPTFSPSERQGDALEGALDWE